MEPAASPPGAGDGAGNGAGNGDDGPSDNLNTWLDAINLSHVYDSLVELGATKVHFKVYIGVKIGVYRIYEGETGHGQNGRNEGNERTEE
jgi:hypothetical protein